MMFVQQLHTMLFNSYRPCCSTVTDHVVQQLHTMLFNNSGVAKGWFLIRKLGVSFLTFSFDSNSFSGGTISKWLSFFCIFAIIRNTTTWHSVFLKNVDLISDHFL